MLKQVGIIILFLVLFCATTFSVAQTNYYTTTKTFYESGYTYNCDLSIKSVELYNVSNQWIGQFPSYKSTGETFVVPDEGIDLFTDASWLENKQVCQAIVNEKFSQEQKETITGQELFIIMYLNTETGKIDDVCFDFHNDEPYAYVPVSVYRSIEVALKERIQFELTSEGRKLNFIYWCRTVVPQK